jgi:hypothetical protein
MNVNLPIFQFLINDEEASGVKAISLVDEPAIQSYFIAFDKQEPKQKYLKLTAYEQVVFGIALQPDLPIFRNDPDMGEYFGVFSKETIKKIVHKFHKEQQTQKVNFDHNDQNMIKAYMFNDYIVDSELQIKDLKAKGIPDAKIGSWVVAYKIEDKNAFEKVLHGEFNGFSVECFLDRVLFSKINNNNLHNMKKDKKTLLEKIVAIFTEEQNFGRSLVPSLGFDIEWGKPGEPVSKITTDPNGNEVKSPIGAGEFATEDAGTIVVDDSSNLTEVRPATKEKTPKAPTVPTVDPTSTTPPTSGDTTSTTGTTATMEAYPWDQCMSDQQSKGYSKEVASKICGWIKANNSSEEMVTDEVLKTILSEDEYLACKKKKFDEEVLMASGDTTNAPAMDPSMMDPTTDPNAEPADVPVSSASTSKTIAEVVGTTDGDYVIEVCVEGGVITEINVTSDLQLLRSQVVKLEEEKKILEDKLKEPIGDPILDAPKEVKPFEKMTAYEKALYNAQIRKG